MNVLVVDDEEDTRRCVRDILEQAGHTATTAVDALEATAHLRMMKYDLILLDIMLPGIDGRQLAQYLSSHWKTFDVPVLVISCRSDRETKEWMKLQGCVGYVEKPFGPAELLDWISEVERRPRDC